MGRERERKREKERDREREKEREREKDLEREREKWLDGRSTTLVLHPPGVRVHVRVYHVYVCVCHLQVVLVTC
jgi:hypothetical protein